LGHYRPVYPISVYRVMLCTALSILISHFENETLSFYPSKASKYQEIKKLQKGFIPETQKKKKMAKVLIMVKNESRTIYLTKRQILTTRI
jgi:hypothetical protein